MHYNITGRSRLICCKFHTNVNFNDGIVYSRFSTKFSMQESTCCCTRLDIIRIDPFKFCWINLQKYKEDHRWYVRYIWIIKWIDLCKMVLYGLTFLNTSIDAAGVFFFFFVIAFEFFDFFFFPSAIRRIVVDWCSSSNSKRLGWVITSLSTTSRSFSTSDLVSSSLLPSATSPPPRRTRTEADSRR
jgi:hypothetical protein